MASYRVNFYKELLSSDGHPFKCLQGRIDVGDAESATQAAECACKVFETTHGVRNWALNADSLEVLAVEAALGRSAGSDPAAPLRSVGGSSK